MAHTLNFNNIKKLYLTITLPDDDNTTLMICSPKKSTMDALTIMRRYVDTEDQVERDSDEMDALYTVTAEIISNNKAGIKITKEHLENILDLEDILVFFNAYEDFLKEIGRGKN